MVISFTSDKVRINGPKVDGSYTVTFDVGEYNQEQVAKLLIIPQMTELNIEVKYGES